MDIITKRFFQACIIVLLTIFTQVGGIIWLLCYPIFLLIRDKVLDKWWKRLAQFGLFCLVYLLICAFLIPRLAESFSNRVPLPVYSNEKLQPINIFTCLMNRHYVSPSLKQTLEKTAKDFEELHAHGIVGYLDGNFPFINGFPLLPHKSHSDGQKVDLAFLYTNTNSKLPMYGETVTAFGYGMFEGPKGGELNMPKRCKNKGAWQYDAIKYFTTNRKRASMKFDEQRTRDLLLLLIKKKNIKKIFIEPHLKQRLRLSQYNKVRFHGCGAVRHDDHIHIQE
ncbi:MAG: hypothetical protein GY827_11210 [Cytophagales bacterium]|nr:hypothetical protein [Cytophagales bacterium]